jgi:hypothetical protein
LPLLAACEVPVYRLRMNRCGSHAKRGTLEHNFTEMSFKNLRAALSQKH